jgi:hypothetical protein
LAQQLNYGVPFCNFIEKVELIFKKKRTYPMLAMPRPPPSDSPATPLPIVATPLPDGAGADPEAEAPKFKQIFQSAWMN